MFNKFPNNSIDIENIALETFETIEEECRNGDDENEDDE